MAGIKLGAGEKTWKTQKRAAEKQDKKAFATLNKKLKSDFQKNLAKLDKQVTSEKDGDKLQDQSGKCFDIAAEYKFKIDKDVFPDLWKTCDELIKYSEECRKVAHGLMEEERKQDSKKEPNSRLR